jgi:hypothetical protein
MYGELASVTGIVDLSQGYAIGQRTYTTVTAQRRDVDEEPVRHHGEQDVFRRGCLHRGHGHSTRNLQEQRRKQLLLRKAKGL